MLPVELLRNQHLEQVELHLRVDADLFWFQGHFPRQPLLPGVAQLDWVMHYGVALLAMNKRFSSVESIKFQRPVMPDSQLKLTLTWNEAKSQLSFRYLILAADGEQVASSGKINLC